MRVLLTGGAGFIGSHVAEAYIKKGYDVFIVDNLSSGKKEFIPKKAVFFEADIESGRAIEKIFAEVKPDVLNHHAAQTNVRKSVTFPEMDARINIVAGINLMEQARIHGVKKVIFASSGASVYGNTKMLPIAENHPPAPHSPQGASKLAFEKYLEHYRVAHGIGYVILRYADIFGPRQNDDGDAGVVSIYIKKVLQNKTVYINGDGSHTRDYVFVEDAAKANVLATANDLESDIYNVGSGIETSDHDLLSYIESKFPEQKITVRHRDAVPGEMQRVCLKSHKIGNRLKWRAKTSLSEGMRKTIWYFKNAGIAS